MKVRSVLFVVCFLCHSFSIQAENKTPNRNRAVVETKVEATSYNPKHWNYNFTNSPTNYFEKKVKIPVSKEGPFIAVSLSWEYESNDGAIEGFLFEYNNSLEVLNLNHHITRPSDKNKSELFFIDSTLDSLTIIGETSGMPVLDLEIHFFNPGNTELVEAPKINYADSRSVSCPCPQPSIMSRAEWCPTGDCPENPNPSTTFASHLIIHHSAGPNTASDWSAVVRSIWDFHVNTNGWSDVGYNWLVDPQGKLYEGRGKDVQGAHFCGTNANTTGICMIGTYTNVEIQTATRQTLTEMLAWYSCTDDIDPLGNSNHSGSNLLLDHISGHRDGCATECPGESFYQTIEDLRMEVADYIEACSGSSGQPDILVEYLLVAPDSVHVGEEITLTAKIKNDGNAPANDVNLIRTLNGGIFATDIISSLAPGASQTMSNTHVFQEVGMVEFCANLDVLANEVNVSNNSSCLNIEVKESLVSVNTLAAAQLAVFPNPGNGVFIIKNEKNRAGRILVYDAVGKVVLTTGLQQEFQQTFNLKKHPKGAYFIKIEIEGTQYFEKIILQ